MKKIHSIWLIGFLLLAIFVISCNQQTIKQPYDLILDSSDLPQDYFLGEQDPILKSNLNQELINLGWKDGHYAIFARLGHAVPVIDIVFIQQSISIYPIKNIKKILELSPNQPYYQKLDYEELPNPNIGKKSRAFKTTTINKYGEEVKGYQIEFIKMDVYESLYMASTTTADYELLKDLAKKAEEKIR